MWELFMLWMLFGSLKDVRCAGDVLSDAIMRLKLGKMPDIDVFSDAGMQILPVRWSPGSDVPDAFSVSCRQAQLQCMNPPFSRLQELVCKVIGDQARAVMLVPHWQTTEWFAELLP